MSDNHAKFLLLQINDALFPIGGYAHSYGLESYVQMNIVRDAETAWDYISSNLLYNLCYTDLLSAKLAYEYADRGKLEMILELDELAEVSKNPEEIRIASRKLGTRFLKTIEAMQIKGEKRILKEYRTHPRKLGHYSVAYGIFCNASGIPWTEALDSYLYAQTSACVTNCVKTIPLSQTAGQQILYCCQELFADVKKKLLELNWEDLYRSTPAFDIRSMQHESLYSRIYMS